MAKSAKSAARSNTRSAAPVDHQRSSPTQKYGTVVHMPVGLSESVRLWSVTVLNQLLADHIAIRDMYKKHHWQVSGPTFYSIHLLFDKHYGEQAELVDTIAERIQMLGGVTIAMAGDVAKLTRVVAPPMDRESLPVQISRLLEAHELIVKDARTKASQASDKGDEGTNDLLISDVVRTHEAQVWFLAEHLVDAPTNKA